MTLWVKLEERGTRMILSIKLVYPVLFDSSKYNTDERKTYVFRNCIMKILEQLSEKEMSNIDFHFSAIYYFVNPSEDEPNVQQEEHFVMSFGPTHISEWNDGTLTFEDMLCESRGDSIEPSIIKPGPKEPNE